jgi:O-antigen/teichoic acid export membrane protein
MAITDIDTPPARRPLARIPERVKAWLASDHGKAQRFAGTAFLIRVASAAVVFLSQILVARWMGSFEFGTYVYVWRWVLLLGDVVHLGVPLTGQRFIPEYTQRQSFNDLRGYLIGSR